MVGAAVGADRPVARGRDAAVETPTQGCAIVSFITIIIITRGSHLLEVYAPGQRAGRRCRTEPAGSGANARVSKSTVSLQVGVRYVCRYVREKHEFVCAWCHW